MSGKQLEGWLEKQGNVGLGKRTLKKRWFCLEGNELHYYKGRDKQKSLGFIPMQAVTGVDMVEDARQRDSIISKSQRASKVMRDDGTVFPFDVITRDRIYHLVAPSQQALMMWMTGLHEIIHDSKPQQRRAPKESASPQQQQPPRRANPGRPETQRFDDVPGGRTAQPPSREPAREPRSQERARPETQVGRGGGGSSARTERGDQRRIDPAEAARQEKLQYQKQQLEVRRQAGGDPMDRGAARGGAVGAESHLRGQQVQDGSSPAHTGVRVPYFDVVRFQELCDRIQSELATHEPEYDGADIDRCIIEVREILTNQQRVEREPPDIDSQTQRLGKARQMSQQELGLMNEFSRSSELMKQANLKGNELTEHRRRTVADMDALLQTMRSNYEDLQELDDQIAKIERELSNIDLDPLRKTVATLGHELEVIPQQMDDAMRRSREHGAEIARLEAEKDRMQQELDSLPGKQRDLDGEEDDIRRRLEELKRLIAELEERRAQTLEEIARVEKQKKALANREKMLGVLKNIIEDESWDELVSTFTLVSNLEKQASSLVDELEDEAAFDLDTTSESDELALKRKQESIRGKARMFEERIIRDRERIRIEEDRLTRDLREIDNELERLKREREALLKKLRDLSARKVDMEHRARQLEMDISSLLARIQQHQQQRQAADDQHEDLQLTRGRKQEQYDKESEKLRAESNRLNQLQSELAGLMRKKAELIEKMKELFSRGHSLVGELDRIRRDFSQNVSQGSTLVQRKGETTGNHRQMLKSRVALLEEVRADLTSMLDDAYFRLGEKRVDVCSHTEGFRGPEISYEEHSKVQAELREANIKVSSLTSEADSLRRKVSGLQDEAARLRSSASDSSSHSRELRDAERRFSTERSELEDKNRKLERKVRDLEGQVRDLEDRARSSHAVPLHASGGARDGEVRELREMLELREEDLKREQSAKKTLYKQLKDLRGELSEQERAMDDLRHDLDQARRRARSAPADDDVSRALSDAMGMSMEPTASKSRGGADAEVLQRLEQELRAREQELASMGSAYVQLQSRAAVLEGDAHVLQSQVSQQQEELRAKDASIVALSTRVAGINIETQKKSEKAELQREIGRLRLAIQAHQMQNAELEYEIKRIENERTNIARSRDHALSDLQKQLERVRQDHQDFRRAVVLGGDTNPQLAEELEDVKKEFFYSLAISVKLNLSANGRYCNVDAAELYEEAKHQVPYQQWHSWLTRRVSEQAMVRNSSALRPQL